MAETSDNSLSGISNLFERFKTEFKGILSESFSLENIATQTLEVDRAARAVAQSFGQGAENISLLKKSMTDSYQEVQRLGHGFDEMYRLQENISNSIGRNIIIADSAYPKLFEMQNVIGVQAEDITSSFKDAGVSLYDTTKQMQDVVDSARAMGVNVEVVSKKVINNLDKLNTYNFRDGVEGLARMASFATATRTDMSQVFAFSEKVYNPEGAIETAAALQRLGVAQSDLLNPLRLMDLSANDPEELQRQVTDLGKSFVELNEKGQFQIMPGEKRRLREIASAMGMQYDQVVKS